MPERLDKREPDTRNDESLEVDPLEAIWALPAATGRESGVQRRSFDRVGAHLGRIVAFGWVVFVGSVFFEPAPTPGSVTPLWADLLVAGFFLALGMAGIFGVMRGGRLAFGAASIAGLLGVSLAVSCIATDHHPVGWWAWELAATSVLTVLALVGLRRLRR
jgi:hypothetical protein